MTESSSLGVEKVEDEELRAAFERFKSKTFALTVPLRIVALRGSIPPSWVKVCAVNSIPLQVESFCLIELVLI